MYMKYRYFLQKERKKKKKKKKKKNPKTTDTLKIRNEPVPSIRKNLFA